MLWAYANHTIKETYVGEIASREGSRSPEMLDRDPKGITWLLTHALHPGFDIACFRLLYST
jgi:hypothetical protein